MDQTVNKDFNLLTLRRSYKQPHEYYKSLRAYDSIYFDPSSQCWLITSHASVSKILSDQRFSSRLDDDSTSPISVINKQMLFLDGVEHKRAQDVMLRPLTLLAKQMPDEIEEFASMALEAMQETGEIDLVSDFASVVSLLSIGRILGIPLEDMDMLGQLEKWSDTFGDLTSGYFQGEMEDVQNLEEYFRTLIAYKRKHPGDDLLSDLIEAKDIYPEEEDLIANCMMVFTAGRVTTKKVIGNGVPLFLDQWAQMQQAYRADPHMFPRLLGEELLRMVTPTRYLMRHSNEDVDLSAEFPGEHLIRRNERVLLFLEAANRDPLVFDQPDTFLPYRRPNRHLAFGLGSHLCPGATLARSEIQVALKVLLSLSDLRLQPQTVPVWNANPNLGGYTSCPVLFQI